MLFAQNLACFFLYIHVCTLIFIPWLLFTLSKRRIANKLNSHFSLSSMDFGDHFYMLITICVTRLSLRLSLPKILKNFTVFIFYDGKKQFLSKREWDLLNNNVKNCIILTMINKMMMRKNVITTTLSLNLL
jgi:hypothetical protein